MHDHLPLSRKVKKRLADSVSRFSRYTILVVGDLMLDVFIWGEVHRISPEAPVPVVEVREETQLLGGTANVVHNAAALGARTIVTGVIGDDSAGRQLVQLLQQVAVPTDGLVVQAERPTTVKTRIIARDQQVVRFDHEARSPLEERSLERALCHIKEHLDHVDGIIVSDYAKGVVTAGLMDGIRSLNATRRIPVIVDPKVQHADLYRDVTMITPNHHEASRMAGIEIIDEPSLALAGRALMERLKSETVLITRGKEGMTLFHRDGRLTNIPTVARRVYDVTGAGDTVIAAITLGIISGLTMEEAAFMANLAAGIVVGEVGTAVVSSDRLLAAIEHGC
jgi:D-glycero-beta-D-manno-heptose-7-phosphate kinase